MSSLPINDRESNEQRSGTHNGFDNTYDQIIDWSLLDAALHQRSYSKEELNEYLADLDQCDDEQSLASRSPFKIDEAEYVDIKNFILFCDDDKRRGSSYTQSSHSSVFQVVAQDTENERNRNSETCCLIELYADLGTNEGPQKRNKWPESVIRKTTANRKLMIIHLPHCL